MARSTRSSSLETSTGRARLKRQKVPYWVKINKGLYIGYSKPGGAWLMRSLVEGTKKYKQASLGIADDHANANGLDVLDYFQAQDKARGKADEAAHREAGVVLGKYKVSDAMDAYLKWAETHTTTAGRMRSLADSQIIPQIGRVSLERLTTERLEEWLAALAAKPARVRSTKGTTHYRETGTNEPEAQRKRKVSANRVLALLTSALSRAFRNGKVTSDSAWRRVSRFKGVKAARTRYLTVEEAKRLINASGGAFRVLVSAALTTGARHSELTRMRVADFDPDGGTVYVQHSKAKRSRHIVLTDEGVALFRRATVGKRADDLLFPRDDGSEWEKGNVQRPMADACRAGRIEPALTFHGLRHTFASLAIMNGTPLLNIAKNMGHYDTRMLEEFYGHLAPTYHRDAIREGAAQFGFAADNVERLRVHQ
jgi:integrase